MPWPNLPYHDRAEAGRALARAAEPYRGRDDLLVLGLARGGIPVGQELAHELGAPLDVLVVRKLGVPQQPELAMGAIATGGGPVLNEKVIASLGIERATIDAVIRREEQELRRREHVYRGDRPRPTIKGRCVFLVDDGLATGSTMRAAVAAVRQHEPGRVVVAVPVAPPDTLAHFEQEADEVICPAAPEWFSSVGQWYRHYPQLDDQTVRALLEHARQPAG